jgi:5-methylcytosine-specific restriction endonuclease McrA
MSCSKELHYAWNNGSSFRGYPSKFNKSLKNKIKIRDNFKCQGCGVTEAQEKEFNNRKLAIHHIDNNKDNCDEANLITTCQACNNGAKRMRNYWTHFYGYKIRLYQHEKVV